MTERAQAGRRWLLLLALLAYTLSFVDRTLIGVVQQPLKAELGLSDAQLGLLGGTAFAIFYSLLGLPIARVAERFGSRAILSAATTAWSVMTIACGASTGFTSLFACRLGVGIGEAGGTAPAHALIARLYPPDRRSRPMAVYSLGVPLGILVGAAVGGLLTDAVGWRLTFAIAGLPGLIVGPLIWLATPPGASRNARLTSPFMSVLRHLARLRSFRHMAAGIVIASLAGYALLAFLPALLDRRFGMTPGDAGLATGLVTGVCAALGTAAGGHLAARANGASSSRALSGPAAALLVAAPIFVCAYRATAPSVMIALLCLGSVAQFVYLAPTYAMAQNIALPDMRATTSALVLFLVNLVGLGMGPPLLGWLSDVLHAGGRSSADSLSVAMAIFSALFVWAAAHYAVAARYLSADLRAVARMVAIDGEPEHPRDATAAERIGRSTRTRSI